MLVLLTITAPDPCKTAMTLTGNRDMKLITKGNNKICDASLTPGWYRLPPGAGEVAMSKVSKDHCGTEAPIWMNGSIPLKGKTQDTQFCFNHLGTPDGCTWSSKTSVKNCNGYLVYKLPLANILCPMAVCSDSSIKPCAQSMSSPTGFQPCKNPQLPTITSITLSAPDQTAPNTYQQACKIKFPQNTDRRARFRVTWKMDGKPVDTVDLTPRPRITDVAEAYFKLTSWTGHINHNLTCSVVTYYSNAPTTTSKEKTSDKYYGGCWFEPRHLNVTTATATDVKLKCSLPLECTDPRQSNLCQLGIALTTHENLYTNGNGNCKMTLTRGDWDPKTNESSVHTSVWLAPGTTKPSQMCAGRSGGNAPSLWNNVTACMSAHPQNLPKLPICRASGDPHFYGTFTYQPKFNLYHVGDFNLASDDSYPIVVQGETAIYKPTHRPTFTAIAVQTFDDVTIIDTAAGTKYPTVAAPRPPKTHTVQSCGTNKYNIYTSAGHRIDITVAKHGKIYYLNVAIIFPNGTSINSHEICRLSKTDIDKYHKVGNAAINKFRTPLNSNIFKGYIKQINTNNVPKRSLCQCHKDPTTSLLDANCTLNPRPNDPVVKNKACKTITPVQLADPVDTPRPQENIFKDYKPIPRQWPSVSGITQTQARDKCHQSMVKHMAPQCVNMTDLHLDQFVDGCAEDVLASDGFAYLSGSVLAVQSKCESLAIAASTKVDAKGNPVLPDLVADSCPNLCSMQGTCVKGVCHCDAGWEWEDCSVNSGQPYKITGIDGGILCDKSKTTTDCFHPVVTVENIGNVTNCKVEVSNYMEGKPMSSILKFDLVHGRRSGETISCNLLYFKNFNFHAKRFRLSFETSPPTPNPGHIDYLIFDGVCQRCLKDLTCFQREDACFINGQCYPKGPVSGSGPVSCLPYLDLDRWATSRPKPQTLAPFWPTARPNYTPLPILQNNVG